VKVRLVALEGVVKGELADAQDLQVQVFNALVPPLARFCRIFEEPQVQNFPDEKFEFFSGVCPVDPYQDA